MNTTVKYAAARLSERSTWIGVIGLLAVFGVNVAPDYQETVISAGATLASLVAMLGRDKSK